jgi:hypothetical protein
MKRTVLILFCALLLETSTRAAGAFEDGSFEAAAADVLVVRPLGFVATILGSALFVVSLPIAAVSDSVSDTAEALVLTPGRMTFTRPVGELSTLTN